jgi:hypothetical protein
MLHRKFFYIIFKRLRGENFKYIQVPNDKVFVMSTFTWEHTKEANYAGENEKFSERY